MLKWKIAVLALAGLMATLGIRGLTGDPARADVASIELSGGLDDAARRDDLSRGLELVLEDDDPAPGTAGNTGPTSASMDSASTGGADSHSAASFSADSFSADSFSADSFSADSFSADSFSADSFSADSFSADSF